LLGTKFWVSKNDVDDLQTNQSYAIYYQDEAGEYYKVVQSAEYDGDEPI
jgi:hypothetical protein